MWLQNYDPLGSPLLSTVLAGAPIVVLLGLLVTGRSAPFAAMAGLTTALLGAVYGFGMPAPMALAAAPEKAASPPPARFESPGKPTGPIAVEHRFGAGLAVGTAVTLTITARVEPGAGELALETTATDPKAVVLSVPALVASGAGRYSWQLTVVPLVVDAGYLTVVVSGEIDGVAQARTVSIALRSEEPPAVAAPPSKNETLIALPVQEGP